jgi:hypothetical protein
LQEATLEVESQLLGEVQLTSLEKSPRVLIWEVKQVLFHLFLIAVLVWIWLVILSTVVRKKLLLEFALPCCWSLLLNPQHFVSTLLFEHSVSVNSFD